MKSLNLLYKNSRSLSSVINSYHYYYTTTTAAAAAFQNPTPIPNNAPFHQNPNFRVYRNESQDPRNYNNTYQNTLYEQQPINVSTIEELDALCKERKLNEAVELLGLLERNGVCVDVGRYFFLMDQCGEAHALEQAKRVAKSVMGSYSYSSDVSVCNKVLEINGHGEDAIDIFTEFKKIGLKPDGQMFYGVFTACSVVGDVKEGLLHFESMSKDYGIVPSMEHYRSVVDMLGSVGYLNEALEFIEKMPMVPGVEVWETLMKQCRVYGETELGDRC
ncbi:pentatricopeptide repeat (PPR) superfamily protein [Artemisia annua]|uniref:Pentatricopeptide repeat (PPR) superfamily protein n=1 Tax=Artemisia annua TaxID=35608 RepID=A0A2U1KBJ5_ARTAN|nr:pentatricopeptide repeat (PPR) superfamily protein [Artemisia annua]